MSVVSLFIPARRARGWSNQEFAEFYRVENSLIRAGLSIETDHGLSDEGDPWFVFCHSETDDIIIHFARIDGIYVVASAALDRCMRGADFRSLIEALIETHPIVIAKGNGVAKITIHPAALIVAVVITCYFKLAQTQAVASQLGVGESHAGPAAGEDHDATLSVLTDDSRSNMVLTAIAVAGTWANLGEADSAPVVGPGATDVIQPMTFTSNSEHPGTWFFPVDNSGLVIEHSGQSADHSQPVVDAGSVDDVTVAPQEDFSQFRAMLQTPSVMTFVSDHFGYASLSSFDDLGPANGVGQNASQGKGDSAWLPALVNETLELKGTSGIASLPVITISPESVQEVNNVLGAAASTHLILDSSGAEPQLVLNLIEHNSGALAHSDADNPATTSQVKGATPNSTASGSVPTFSETSVSSHQALVAFDDAVSIFISTHPGYQILESRNNVVLFDTQLTPTSAHINVAVYNFPDGSEVTLVGITPHTTHVA